MTISIAFSQELSKISLVYVHVLSMINDVEAYNTWYFIKTVKDYSVSVKQKMAFKL